MSFVSSVNMKILFMCVANSARSQLAEALAKNIFGTEVFIIYLLPKFIAPSIKDLWLKNLFRIFR